MTTAIPNGKAVAMAAALAALVFVVVPGSLYLGNLPDFRAAPWPLFRLLLVPALLSIALVMVGLRIARPRDSSRLTAVLAALTLLVWAQAYLLVWDYGALDGTQIDWSADRWRGWVDFPAWVAVLAAAVAFHQRLEKPLATAAIVVVLLQTASVAGNGFLQRGALEQKGIKRQPVNRLEAMGRFSPDRNVLHIVLDSFQADVFSDIVRGDGGARVQASLPGFTFFEEHLGSFPATYLAMPVIVSGMIYRNQMPQREFMEDAYTRGSILRAARNAGFEVDIAVDAWLLELMEKGGVDNVYLKGGLQPGQEAAKLLDLALFRLAPHWLKPSVYNEQRWLAQRWSAPADLLTQYFVDNTFLTEVTRRIAVDRARPVYKFFHLMTTHRPFVVNPDCSPAGQVLPRVRETVTAQSRCSVAFVVALLNQMKRAGVYDNTMIVLMADHGGHIDPHRYVPGMVSGGGQQAELRAHEVAMATPLLAIKPPGDTAPFRISSAFTSMADVPATIDATMQLNGQMPGRSILDNSRPPQERRYYFYKWSPRDPVSEYIQWIGEFTITGSVYQAGSWRPTASFDPPGQ